MAEPEEGEAPHRRKDPSGWDGVAERLLDHNYLLSALELYTESLEAGREIPRLRDFFSNPGNFVPTQPQQLSGLVRSASCSTFDSLDVSRYSDDGNEPGDDRLAVLEFELRKAKETIASLRGSLTHAAETEQVPRDTNVQAVVETAKPHEVRALNFLTNQFLLKTGMRLTSITFSDEVEAQDLESWDNVGLDTPQPPELLQLYRNYSSHVASNFTVLQENERLASELTALEAELIALRRENEKSQARIRDLEKRRANTSTAGTNSTPPPSITVIASSESRHTVAEPIIEVPSNTSIGGQSTTTLEESHTSHTQVDFTTTSNSTDQEDTTTTTTQEGDDEQQEPQHADNARSGSLGEITAEAVVTEAMSTADTGRVTAESPSAGDPMARQISLRNSRSMSTAFRQALLASSQTNNDSRLAKEVTKLMSGGQDCVVVLGRALPHIVPNVLLNKRDELIPLLLCAATLHPEERDRDQLLNFLFNLIKKPNAEQRQMIITGCVAFAKHNGPIRLEAELLPQCWEQISHKYVERRLLVAESCGALAPYLPAGLRSSLLLSMLKQMLVEDKSDEVRAAVTRTLGLLVAFIDDADKYNQCYDLMVSSLSDADKLVVDAARRVFLPALAAWAYELQILETKLLSCLLVHINTHLTKVSNSLSGQEDFEKVLRQEEILVMWVNAFEALLTWQIASLLQSGPYAQEPCPPLEDATELQLQPQPSSEPLLDLAVIVGSSEDVVRLRALFESYTAEESWTQWKEVKWLMTDFLPKLTDFLIQLSVGLGKAVSAFIQLLQGLCQLLGRSFVNSKIRPFFDTILSPENQADRPSSARIAALSSALLPCFVCGVLNCFPEDQAVMTSTLHKLMCYMALNVLPLESVQITFLMLSEDKNLHMALVEVLWESLRSSTIQIRCATASLVELLIKDMDETLVATRFVPALVTLASDDDMAVRVASVGGFGSLMECAKQKSLLEKAQVQLTSFLDEPTYEEEHAMHVEIIKTLGRVGPNSDPMFRDQFVLPRLHSLAAKNNTSTNRTKRRDIAMELHEAFRTLACCFIPADQIGEHLLPALRCLLSDMQDIDVDSVESVKSLISEVESKTSDSSSMHRASLPGSEQQGAKTRLMRALMRRDSSQSVNSGGLATLQVASPSSSAGSSASPKVSASRDVRNFFRLNK
eukprot:scpid10148/ scgid21963/ LisH domain and HEAT repeat-containing protein KIAA1468 homolog